MYARAYILHMFGGFIFTSTAGNAIPLYFLTILDYLLAIPNYRWGGHACIPATLQSMSKKEKTNCRVSPISSCIYILNYLINIINSILNNNL